MGVGNIIQKNLNTNMSHGRYLKLGRKGLRKEVGGWESGFVKPGTRADKRKASRRVRDEYEDIPDGNFYKKLWGYWEWS